MIRPLAIANASGFWGDQPEAAVDLVAARPDLDFLTLDYLAEVSLSIMAILRARDPVAGYARDFVETLKTLVPFYRGGGRTRIVTNAGGLDPAACGRACAGVLKEAGLGLRIAVVTGDDVLPQLQADPAKFANLESDEALGPLASRLATANAYLGAESIAAALHAGADIVITGRVADPSLTVGPCLAHFGWAATEVDAIAGATVAGHLIECGTQVCGGFSTDWLHLPRRHAIGFPIVEVAQDGSCIVTKSPGSGGAVTVATVKEQLLYEIGDPGHYLSPDVTVSLLDVRLSLECRSRVRVAGARGRAPTENYKVSATYRDGYKAHGLLTVFGHDAVRKARAAGEGILRRLAERGVHFRETLVECLGTGASVKGVAGDAVASLLTETVLRVSVAAEAREPVERFTKEIAPLVTCGPQGVTGYATGRPKVLPIFGYWPTLVSKAAVPPKWTFI